MNYLLDTSSFLWFVYDDGRLSARAAELLGDSGNSMYLSLASVWEVAIKANLGRGLLLLQPFPEFIDEQLKANRFQLLNISVAHLKVVSRLPHFHRDPFDRLLIAQSLSEDLPVISNDAAFDDYQVQRLW